MSVLTLTNEEEFRHLVEQHDTVVIDFWAPWCAPCKGFVPTLEKASRAHPEIVFCRVDTEEQKDLAKFFDVEFIPTLAVVREKIVVASETGSLPAETLEDLIEKVKALDMEMIRREITQEAEMQSPS